MCTLQHETRRQSRRERERKKYENFTNHLHKSQSFLQNFKKYFFEEVNQHIIHMYLLEAHAINLSYGKTFDDCFIENAREEKAHSEMFTVTTFINLIKFSLCTRNRGK